MSGGDRKASTFVGRLILAHLVAYPIALAWTVAAMPLTFPILDKELTQATGDTTLWSVPMPAVAAIVVRASLVVGGVFFLVEHAIGLVWALGKEPAKARRRFTIGSLILGGVGVVGAAAGWIWFFFHYGGDPP